jgi:peptide/nickel transport system substrate-binding protein
MTVSTVSRRSRSRSASLLLAASLVCGAGILVAACGGTGSSSGGSSGSSGSRTFVMAQGADPAPIDPALVTSTYGYTFTRNVYESLVYYKLGTTDIVPVLATSWKVSPNGLTYTFTLRQGVKFQSGASFTSADVKATFDRDMALPSGVGGRYLADVASVSTSGPYTVSVTLKKPYAYFVGQLPKIGITSAADITAHGGSDHAQSWFASHADGTGPWMMSSYTPGTQYTLVRNPHYWQAFGPKAFNKIIVQVVSSSSTMAELIERGQANMGSWMTFSDMVSAAKTSGVKLIDTKAPMMLLGSMCGGCGGPISKVQVRQALVDAFPYSQMQSFYQGHSVIPGSVLSASYPGAEVFPPLHQNLAAAKQLLAQAGYPHGGFTLRTVAVQGLGDERQAALLEQSALAGLGVQLQIQVLPFATFLKQAENASTAPDISFGYEAPETDDPFEWFDKLFGTGPAAFLNLTHMSVPALNATIQQAQSTTSAPVRLQLLHKAQQLISTNALAIPFANFDGLYAVSSWLGGFTNDITDLLYVPKFFSMSQQ